MSIQSFDIAFKSTIESIFALVRSDVDRWVPEIFGSLTQEPMAKLYGKKHQDQIKEWFLKTKIPVVLGWDLSQTQLPCVTVNFGSMSPAQAYLGDRGQAKTYDLAPNKIPIIVAAFQPKLVTYSSDRTYVLLDLPDSMPEATKNLFFPGLRVRDAGGRYYVLSTDDNTGKPKLTSSSGLLEKLDASQLEVVSPFDDELYSSGAMLYDQSLTVTIHAHSDRNDAIWLWQIVFWGLLKFRPTIASLFQVDLTFSSSGPLNRAEQMGPGEHVFTRDINVTCKSLVTWSDTKQEDILGFLFNFVPARVDNS